MLYFIHHELPLLMSSDTQANNYCSNNYYDWSYNVYKKHVIKVWAWWTSAIRRIHSFKIVIIARIRCIRGVIGRSLIASGSIRFCLVCCCVRGSILRSLVCGSIGLCCIRSRISRSCVGRCRVCIGGCVSLVCGCICGGISFSAILTCVISIRSSILGSTTSCCWISTCGTITRYGWLILVAYDDWGVPSWDISIHVPWELILEQPQVSHRIDCLWKNVLGIGIILLVSENIL